MTERRTLEAGPDDAGLRLDRFLALKLGEVSRSRLKALIEQGQVSAGGRTIEEPGYRVKPGLRFVVELPEPEPATPEPEAIALDIVYEDDALIVVDKPAGLVVHPAIGHRAGTLVNALIAHCGASLSGIGGVRRPGIVHRLDKETSGLLVVAKTDAAHQGLSDQFRAHGRDGRLERAYLALAWGVPPRRKGRIEAPLARHPRDRKRMAVVAAGGREAVTHYEVQETFAGRDGRPVASLLRCVLETGRTHQIRIHLAHIGHPVLGDPVYGRGLQTRAAKLPDKAAARLSALGRQALHACELGFVHPRTGRRLRFQSPLPCDIDGLLKALRLSKGKAP
ncbi:MAG: RluA family pseudouridine synthase [Hyphomicrobiaceae bacterium]